MEDSHLAGIIIGFFWPRRHESSGESCVEVEVRIVVKMVVRVRS